MKNRAFELFGATVLLSIFGVTEASAQQVDSFAQIRLLVKAGDTVTIVEPGGKQITVRIDEISALSLRVRARGGTRELLENQVAEIRQRRDDSLHNGARNGLWAGLILGAFGTLGTCFEIDHGSGCAAAAIPLMAFYGSIGAAAGVGIDALIVREQTIYRPAVRGGSSGLRLSPLLGKQLWGAGLALSF